ncbi:MAG: hypothetical protein JJ896_00250 [Rhodothermales bacterium]|nr:hypothetical protein [Rhodothermales bacterium]MBO6778056.1 hypothetical protein [Rhodothermales bacterium]
MELDLAVLREVMLKVRAEASLSSAIATASVQLEGYEDGVVAYHTYLLLESGHFITHLPSQPIGVVGNKEWPSAHVYGLSMLGQEKLAALEEDTVFTYMMDKARSVGQAAVWATLRPLLIQFVGQLAAP